DAGAEASDAGALADAGRADAGALAGDAGAEGEADAGPKPIREPALAAGVRQITDPNANVRLWIHMDRVRENPLAPRVGLLLRGVSRWRDSFGPNAIDPVRDLDQIFISGSQLRDTSGVAVVLQHHLPPERMRAALDALVKADPQGAWLDAPLPAAKF